jgi:predicted nicotinamide N-methyase
MSSLVPYHIETSSSDDNEGPDPKEIRKKSISSPRKRKRNYGRSLSSKLFPGFNQEDEFQDVFPIDSEGAIDVNSLFDPTYEWSDELNKTLEQFSVPNAANCVNQTNAAELQELSDTEYELDLSTLELVPTLMKPKKKFIEDSGEEAKEYKGNVQTKSNNSCSNDEIGKTENDNEDKFTKPKLKPKCRKFIFKPFARQPDGSLSHDDHKSSVEIIIPEQLAASYGLYIWPCSPVLAWYIWLHQEKFHGKHVLELGSGTALPGLLCAKIGARNVWLSDDSLQPKTLQNCLEAVKINQLENNTDVIGLTWGQYTENLVRFSSDKLDYIIGSDLLFDPKVFEPLIKTLSFLLDINPKTEVLITVQERSSDWTLEEYLNKWKLCCDYIYPKTFLKGTGIDESDLIGGHTIFILRIFNKKLEN